MSRRIGIGVVLAVLSAVAGCASIFGRANPDQGALTDGSCCSMEATDLQLTYLGTGGWLLQYDGVEVLTAPFFSHPTTLRTGVAPIGADTAAVGRALAVLPSLARVTALFVGHAHYDHLMDVPFVVTRQALNSHVYGSRTTANILAAVPDLAADRVHDVESAAASVTTSGSWLTVPGGRVRFLPLIADHAPHFQGIELYEGQVTEPLDRLPSTAREWVGGTTLGFLIDLLDVDGSVAFRVHYLDSSTEWPGGAIPDLEPRYQASVDVAILCAPSYTEVVGYPDGLIGTSRPRYALAGHWETFFAPWSKTPKRSVFGSDPDGFTKRLAASLPDSSTWALPHPGDVIRVPRATLGVGPN